MRKKEKSNILESVGSIIHKEIRILEEGDIDYTGITTKPNCYHLRARANVKPNMINNFDGRFWNEGWKNIASNLGIEYDSYNSVLFSKEVYDVHSSTIADFEKKSTALLKAHHKATIKYNNEISEPYIKERSELINKIIQI